MLHVCGFVADVWLLFYRSNGLGAGSIIMVVGLMHFRLCACLMDDSSPGLLCCRSGLSLELHGVCPRFALHNPCIAGMQGLCIMLP